MQRKQTSMKMEIIVAGNLSCDSLIYCVMRQALTYRHDYVTTGSRQTFTRYPGFLLQPCFSETEKQKHKFSSVGVDEVFLCNVSWSSLQHAAGSDVVWWSKPRSCEDAVKRWWTLTLHWCSKLFGSVLLIEVIKDLGLIVNQRWKSVKT